MRSTIILAAAFAALSPAPVAAQAGPQTVRYDDLRLDRASDVRRLDRRIGRALRAVCGEAAAYDLHGGNGVRRCRETTRASVVAARDRLIAGAQGTAVAAR